jgi:hypothetical protein
LQGTFRGCRGLSEAAGDFQGLQGNFRGCRRLSAAAGDFQRLQGTFRGCRRLSQAARKKKRLAFHRLMDSHLVGEDGDADLQDEAG